MKKKQNDRNRDEVNPKIGLRCHIHKHFIIVAQVDILTHHAVKLRIVNILKDHLDIYLNVEIFQLVYNQKEKP